MTAAGPEAGLAVSVVVPTLDRPARVAAVVRGLLAGDEVAPEILVVDQSEDDGTARALDDLEDERVRRLAHRPPSTSEARNAGARAARGEYVAFLDDDVELARTWLASVRAELRALGLPDAIFGEVHEPEGFVADRTHLPVSLFHVEQARVWEKPVHPNRVGYAANFVCRRAAFLELGGFDARLGPGTRFRGAEDMDLAYRLLKGGYRVASSPAFPIVHQQWREPEALPRLFYGYNVGGSAFCAKHLRAGDARAALFLLVQVRDDAKMFASALRRRSRLRARVAAARTAGTWSGLARGLMSLGGGASPRAPGTSPESPPPGGS
jgi:glycosyltransferase involved in cell wall biosynthesis